MVTQGTTVGSWSYTGLTTKPLWQQSGETNKGKTNGYAPPLTYTQMRYLNEKGFRPDQYDSPIARSILTGMPKDWKPTVSKPEAPKEQPQQKPKDTPWYKTPAALWGGAALLTIGAGALAYFSGGLGSGFSAAMLTKATAMAGLAKTVAVGTGIAATAAVMTSCSDEEDFSMTHKGSHDLEINYELFDIPEKTITVTKTDTIYQDVLKTDTLYLPGEVVRDTIFQEKTDTLYLPGETIIKNDTIFLPGETIIEKDTIYVPGETIYETITDTLYLPGETVRDTIFQKEIVTDTIFQDRPVYIEVPGEEILVPDTLRPEPDPIIDDFTHNVLKQNNDTTGVTVRVTGDKQYEQLLHDAILDVNETTNKKMVFKNFNIAYEDDENPKKFYTKAEVSVGTLNDGRKGLYVSLIPAWAGFNYKTYYSGIEQDWNRNDAKNLMIVKSADGKALEKYTQGANGEFVFAGTISSKEQTVLKDKNLLPESGQTWEQKIKSFETQSAYVVKNPGEGWQY